MINPGDIVEAFAAQLRDVPELVAAQGPRAAIIACHPEFASQANFQRKLHAVNPGDILVRWLGTGPGSLNENRIWKHQLGIYVRPFDTAADDAPGSHYLAAKLIPGLDLMDIPTLRMVVDTEGLEYALITFGIPETGDY